MSSVIISVSVALLTIALNAAINIRIKFASDATAASQDLKALTLRICSWLLAGYLLFDVYRTVTSTEPVTRLTVFGIASQVAFLMFVIVSFLLKRIIDFISNIAGRILESMMLSDKHFLEATGKHMEITKELIAHFQSSLESSRTNPPDKNG